MKTKYSNRILFNIMVQYLIIVSFNMIFMSPLKAETYSLFTYYIKTINMTLGNF